MDAPLYDVYLTGKLGDGVTPEIAAQRLATLFKSTPATMAGLITGNTQLLKRGVDKNTALKYRDALQNVGCEVTFKAQTNTPTAAKPAVVDTAPTPTSVVTPQTAGLQLAPAGTDLLRAEERHSVAAATVDTRHLSVAPLSPFPMQSHVNAIAPDTGDLALAPVGGNLVDASERQAVPSIEPDISGLSVAAVGAPIDTLKSDVAPVQPDISQLQLAPAGADLLTPEQRKRAQPAAPNTDHIRLAP